MTCLSTIKVTQGSNRNHIIRRQITRCIFPRTFKLHFTDTFHQRFFLRIFFFSFNFSFGRFKDRKYMYVSGMFLFCILMVDPYFIQTNKGGKFLKKLWCCVGGKVKENNLVLSTQLIILSYHILYSSFCYPRTRTVNLLKINDAGS